MSLSPADPQPTAPENPAPEPARPGASAQFRLNRGWLVPVALLMLSLALLMPWPTRPFSTMIGLTDEYHGEAAQDLMLPITLAGWLRMAPLELGQWPLARSNWLMYPGGASHGASFDGLLYAIVTALLSLVMPLPLAHSLAVVLAFFMTGWALWWLGRRLWGPGWAALAIALAGVICPFLFLRSIGHSNLMYVWTIPLAMLAFERWRSRPDAAGTLGWGLSFPLLALASWYTLIAGLIFQSAATLALLGHRLAGDRAVGRRHLLTLPLAWLLGMGLVLAIAWPMLRGLDDRRPIPVEEIAGFSAPLAQYLLPLPYSPISRQFEWFQQRQQALGTPWEGLVCVPPLLMLLGLGWFLGRGRSVGKTALILTALLGVLATMGPFLQVARALPPGEPGLRMPLYYLLQLWEGFGFMRVPGRAGVVVFFALLVAAGHGLAWAERSLAPRPRLARFLWPPLLALLLLGSLAWSRPGPIPLSSWPWVSQFYRDLGRRPGEGAVFDIPFSWYWLPHYGYYQLTHKRPVVSSVLFHDAVDDESLRFLRERPHLFFFHDDNGPHLTEENARRLGSLDFLHELHAEGIDYLVFHPVFLRMLVERGLAAPDSEAWMRQVEAGWRDRLVGEDHRIRAYRTAPDPE